MRPSLQLPALLDHPADGDPWEFGVSAELGAPVGLGASETVFPGQPLPRHLPSAGGRVGQACCLSRPIGDQALAASSLDFPPHR